MKTEILKLSAKRVIAGEEDKGAQEIEYTVRALMPETFAELPEFFTSEGLAFDFNTKSIKQWYSNKARTIVAPSLVVKKGEAISRSDLKALIAEADSTVYSSTPGVSASTTAARLVQKQANVEAQVQAALDRGETIPMAELLAMLKNG